MAAAAFFNTKKIMTVIDLGLGNITTINTLNGKLSDSASIGGLNNRQGIVSVELSFSVNFLSGTPKFRLQQSLDNVKWDDVRDNDGAAIDVTITQTLTTAVFTATFVNVHTSYVRIKGTASGSNGTISGIKILAK